MIHIYCPPVTRMFRRRRRCPTCHRRAILQVTCWEWHASRWTCLACGDEWSEDERCERPFRPGWRAKQIAAARQAWREWQRRPKQRSS